ncbi:MAG: alanine--tRNA ligase [Armatimonadetes bacterium]|nr:alanine--tRNA ligase [Armatimonadota bacterium]
MNASELRRKYLRFFESKGHSAYPSGSLVPYDVTGRLDESLLFNGAGMVQFKPYFRGVAKPENPRLTTAQKCVRTGDIDEVGDLSHLTFFEMLGNFSFGDYFKAEAIDFSWEFLTSDQFLALDPSRLSFTVFEEDDEAYECWSKHLRSVAIAPETRIFRLGEETNYWPAGAFSAGPPGPCGPNSEMFYWCNPSVPVPSVQSGYGVSDYLRDDQAGNWLEIWNDVFIQFEWQGRPADSERPGSGYVKEGMPELPFKSIDTGMGLERTSAVLLGKQSVYDTDVFTPILERIQSLSGKSYGKDDATDRAMRVIADHIRTSCFCIADGILPSNNGRGYVLRRLIRRAVLKGQRVLGFDKPFFHGVFPAVVEAMGDHYGELVERKPAIEETLRNEEDLFRRTLHSGYGRLQSELERMNPGDTLPGESAFRLYDTFGFPLEVTKELCDEADIRLDEVGYETAMKEAQARSHEGSGMDAVYAGVSFTFVFGDGELEVTPTQFLGYELASAQAMVRGAVPEVDEDGRCTGRVGIALDQTPFYAESGGQISDTGLITGESFEFRVIDLIKQDGVYVHFCEPVRFNHPEPLTGMAADHAAKVVHHQLFDHPVVARIDLERRRSIMRNHTATHLLHAALRSRLGKHVTQAGSRVAPNELRFDFTHGKAISHDDLAMIERDINEQIWANTPVITYVDLPIEDAKARGAMALFGEKYGNRVRMVEIGEYSRELCGGTHVAATGEIGLCRIVSESSAASGVRRIEAVTGEGTVQWLNDQVEILRTASGLLKSSPKDLVHSIEKLLETVKDERRKREQLASQGAGASASQVDSVGSVELATQKLTAGDPKDAQLVADRLVDGKPARVALVGLVADGKVSFVCKVGAEALSKGAHAGNLLREVAKIAGGGGGGKPDFATAGGRDADKVDEALSAGVAVLKAMVAD